jgi:hypothetical protein
MNQGFPERLDTPLTLPLRFPYFSRALVLAFYPTCKAFQDFFLCIWKKLQFLSGLKDPFADHTQTFHHLNKNSFHVLHRLILLGASLNFQAYTISLLSSRLQPSN